MVFDGVDGATGFATIGAVDLASTRLARAVFGLVKSFETRDRPFPGGKAIIEAARKRARVPTTVPTTAMMPLAPGYHTNSVDGKACTGAPTAVVAK